ncbi:DHGL-like protein [Mya arenaria]|uniref:DHGL-like protein n=1 Tax=Mya arenaria TaxID=6604 RepID=A0ABY7EVP3_MYAAR|nr:DHGL-like protein [Mya arenaria]
MPFVVTEILDNAFDYIVVGAGSAGAFIASRLSKDVGSRVLLLEAEGDYKTNASYHVPIQIFDLQKTRKLNYILCITFFLQHCFYIFTTIIFMLHMNLRKERSMESLQTLSILIAICAIIYFTWLRGPSMPSVVTETLDEYDFIVVAGAVIASRLSDDVGSRVLLLEAGGDYTTNASYHVPIQFFNLQKTSADWEYYTVPQKYSHQGMIAERSYWPRGRLLGGSSTINAMQYTRGSRHDYDE